MNKKFVFIIFTIMASVVIFWFQKHGKKKLEEKGTDSKLELVFDKKIESFLNAVNAKDDLEKEKKKVFEEFVDGPMIDFEFEALSSMLDSQISQIEKLQIPQTKKTEIVQAFKEVFDVEEIYASYLKNLYEQFSLAELKELNEVYSDSTVIKALKSMQHIRTASGQKEFAEYLKELPKKSLSEVRKEQLKKYDEVTGMTKNSAQLINQVMGLMHDSIEKDSTQITQEQVKARENEKNALEQYMAEKVHEGVMLTLAKAHHEVNDQEMTEILNLRGKPAAVKEGKLRVDNVTNFISTKKAKHGMSTIMNSSVVP